jgi:hypothetical protein
VTFRLSRLPQGVQLVGKDGQPTRQFSLWWQRLVGNLEAQEAAQDAIINRIRRISSHTQPTTILSAEDNGADCSVTVLDHARIYADATTLAITGSTTTGLTSDMWYACYYDDTTLADTTPDFVFTTNVDEAQNAVADGRHFCGLVKTPVAASGETIESGGAYPMGAAAIGGEML